MNNHNVFTNVADLAIPFGLLFAMKAFKKTQENKPKQSKPKAKPKKGGACSACSGMQRGGTKEMIQRELSKITEDLKNILSM